MKFLSYIGYIGFRILLFSVKIIPFKILYLVSDFYSFLIFKVFRYRVKTININLGVAFPDMSDSQKKEIRKNFYKHFTDLFLESLKGYTMTPAQISERYIYGSDREIVDNFRKKNQSIIVAYAHYGNWEWATQTVLYEGFQPMAALYKPLKNIYINGYMKKLRQQRGTHLCPIEKTRFMFGMRKKQTMGFVLLGDQNPPQKHSIWADFMGRKTLCLHGIETYSKMFDLPVIYLESEKTARGKYLQHISVIVDNPSECKQGEITQRYMSAVEKSIRRNPAYWLWSHKRWKHTLKEDGTLDTYGKLYK